MTQLAGSIAWRESQTYQGPVAIYQANLATDPVWSWPLDGLYQQHRIRPAFVTVDNLANAQEVAILFGPVRFAVNEYSRLTFTIPDQAQTVILQAIGSASSPVTITFSISDLSKADTSNVYAIRGGVSSLSSETGGVSPLIAAGVQLVGALVWQESQAYQGPVSLNTADLSTFGTWIYTIDGFYQQARIRPAGITIDNLTSAQQVSVSFGPVVFVVNQFSRMTFLIPHDAATVQVQGIGAAASAIAVTFAISDLSKADTTNLYAVQAAVQSGYLPLTGGVLAGPGNLTVSGTLNVTGQAAFAFSPVAINTAAGQQALINYQATRLWQAGQQIDGTFLFYDGSAGAARMIIGTTGLVTCNAGLALPNAGLSTGSTVAPGGALDLSQHIALYSTTYGFSVTANALNLVANGAAAMVLANAGATIPGTLNVAGAAAFTATLAINKASGQQALINYQATRLWLCGQQSDGTFIIYDATAGASRITITATGTVQVGVGVTAQTFVASSSIQCVVAGSATASVYLQNANRAWYMALAGTDSSFNIVDQTGAINRMSFTVGAGATINSVLTVVGNFLYVANSATFYLGLTGTEYVLSFGSGYFFGWNFSTGTLRWVTQGNTVQAWICDPSGTMTVATKGWQPGGGSWGATSDSRIKTVLGEYAGGLDEIMQLRPVHYVYKGNDIREPGGFSPHLLAARNKRTFVGLVAQELEPVFPDMVSRRRGWIDGEEVSDLRDVDASSLIYAVVNAIQQLAARLERLEARLEGAMI